MWEARLRHKTQAIKRAEPSKLGVSGNMVPARYRARSSLYDVGSRTQMHHVWGSRLPDSLTWGLHQSIQISRRLNRNIPTECVHEIRDLIVHVSIDEHLIGVKSSRSTATISGCLPVHFAFTHSSTSSKHTQQSYSGASLLINTTHICVFTFVNTCVHKCVCMYMYM